MPPVILKVSRICFFAQSTVLPCAQGYTLLATGTAMLQDIYYGIFDQRWKPVSQLFQCWERRDNNPLYGVRTPGTTSPN